MKADAENFVFVGHTRDMLRDVFILDSAATTSITSREELLNEIELLKEPVNVSGVSGNLYVMKSGNLQTIFGNMKVLLANIGTTLVSMSQLASLGCKFTVELKLIDFETSETDSCPKSRFRA